VLTKVRFECKADLTIKPPVSPENVTGYNLRSRRQTLAFISTSTRTGFFSLTEIIRKRRSLYEGIERSRSLTQNSNELASYRKTRKGFRH
jgi:hypothetical protein